MEWLTGRTLSTNAIALCVVFGVLGLLFEAHGITENAIIAIAIIVTGEGFRQTVKTKSKSGNVVIGVNNRVMSISNAVGLNKADDDIEDAIMHN